MNELTYYTDEFERCRKNLDFRFGEDWILILITDCSLVS